MKPTFIDSHAHITSPAIYGDIDAVLERAKSAHISDIMNICTDADTLEKGIKVAKTYPWVHNVGATTPHDVDKEGEKFFPLFEKHARNGDLVAIGETGLDYHYSHSKPETQKQYLRKYFHLALECSLPVVIHCRDAFQDFFDILDAEYTVNNKHAPGVLHCFTGTLKEAEEVIKRGWYLSLSGIVTFKKSIELREVAKIVPINQLLIETDAPYLAPQSHRGKQNEPSFLPDTARVIAEEKNLSIEEIARVTSENARSLFRI